MRTVSFTIEWEGGRSICNFRWYDAEHGKPCLVETAVAGSSCKGWKLWLRAEAGEVPDAIRATQRVDAPEGHINNEDVFVLNPTGQLQGVYYPTPDSEYSDSWQDGDCLYYSKYVDFDTNDHSMNVMARLDDWCIALLLHQCNADTLAHHAFVRAVCAKTRLLF